MNILLEICEAYDWAKLFFDLAEKMKMEEHLLPQKPEDLLSQFKNGLSAIALYQEEIVGHVTIWHIASDWYEIGTTYVDLQYRGRHINFNLYTNLLNKHTSKNIIETTTNPVSIHVGEKLKFVSIKRNSLPTEAFHGTCICMYKKTESTDPLSSCKLAWNGDSWEQFATWLIPCHVRVTPETYTRNPSLKRIGDFKSKRAFVVT